MKMNKWTLGLAALGLVSLTSAQAEEAKLVPVETALSATTISGYVDTSAEWNPGTGNANPAPYSFNTPSKRDGFNIDVVDLNISKAIDPSVPWSAGYTVDMLFGPDASAITGGNASGSDLSGNIRQAYVDLSAPVGNVPDLKIGRFDTILGFESIDSYKNPNWTRSYGFTLEPTEHTGVIAHYKVAEFLAVDAGVADTVTTGPLNTRSITESKKAYMGLVTLTAPKSWGFLADDTLAAGVAHGPGALNKDKTHVYAGANLNTPLKDLKLGIAYDALFDADAMAIDPTTGVTSDKDFGFATALAGYLTYNLTEKFHASVRADYARGAILGALANDNASTVIATPNDFHKVIALTGTLSYDLWANVITRVEVRWDHALDHSTPFGGTVAGAHTENNEVLVAANLVYKF